VTTNWLPWSCASPGGRPSNVRSGRGEAEARAGAQGNSEQGTLRSPNPGGAEA